MTEVNAINQLLKNASDIQRQIQRDQETLDSIRSNIQTLLEHNRTTEDPVLDVILRYGLPHEQPYLEQNLRRLDERLREYAGEFILIELITSTPSHSKEPARHQTVVGVIDTNKPTMRYVNEEGVFLGIALAIQSKDRVLLSEDVIAEFTREDRPHLGALLNSGESFSIFIGHDEVTSYLLPSHISRSIPEEPKTREARMKPIIRQLNDLMIDHGMLIDEYPVLKKIID